ncbi:hypothetical protein H106_06825 [Trichophyton rubrum CBS 735.88]|nr:hypothetical protein H106_06825 [Trichophyton rubrum CBS 735.88]
MSPFFLGPRQMTASSRLGSINWMLMTAKLSDTQTGFQPSALTWIVSASTSIILGMEGPQMSASMMPTVDCGFEANACASRAEKVDLPTPPLPESTRILCLIDASRAVMSGMSGSGPLGAEAHIAWFGHPAQASPFPACDDVGPGQCSILLVAFSLPI